MAGIFRSKPDIATLNATGAHNMIGYLGIEVLEIGEDYLTGRMPVDHRTHQSFGILHGGASVVLAETLGSFAANFTVDNATHFCVGLEINANHIRSVKAGYVYGRATPIHLGRSTQVWDIRITTEDGKLVCITRLTVAVMLAGGAGIEHKVFGS
jgi:1,4-dihydroxy-2-naphthoyl-CoA hydrolase